MWSYRAEQGNKEKVSGPGWKPWAAFLSFTRHAKYLQLGPKVKGFHEPDTWSRSFKIMFDNKECKRNLRSLVRRRNHYTEGLS